MCAHATSNGSDTRCYCWCRSLALKTEAKQSRKRLFWKFAKKMRQKINKVDRNAPNPSDQTWSMFSCLKISKIVSFNSGLISIQRCGVLQFSITLMIFGAACDVLDEVIDLLLNATRRLLGWPSHSSSTSEWIRRGTIDGIVSNQNRFQRSTASAVPAMPNAVDLYPATLSQAPAKHSITSHATDHCIASRRFFGSSLASTVWEIYCRRSRFSRLIATITQLRTIYRQQSAQTCNYHRIRIDF